MLQDVENIALWVGLIFAIAGIVLAIITIRFAEHSDKRAQAVNDQVIRSLQKIETEVERTSSDTKNLIRVAWERMIAEAPRQGHIDILRLREIAEGLAAEAKDKAETSSSNSEAAGSTDHQIELFERLAQQLERSLENSDDPERDHPRRGSATSLPRRLSSLSVPAVELIGLLLRGGHVTQDHVEKMPPPSSLRRAFEELREAGILIPLRHEGETGVVYWFPPSTQSALRDALFVTRNRSYPTKSRLYNELRTIGYDTDLADGVRDAKDDTEQERSEATGV